MMAHHEAPQPRPEVIDLVSDDESESQGRVSHEPEDPFIISADFAAMDFNAFMDMAVPPTNRQPSEEQDDPPHPAQQAFPDPGVGGSFVDIDGDVVFIPDEVEPQPPPQHYAIAGAADDDAARDQELAVALANGQVDTEADAVRDDEIALAFENTNVTADGCLQRVLSIFPDISHEYVFKLYNDFETEGDYEVLPGQARLDNIIEQLVSNPSYPKQEKGKKPLKRKREESDDDDSIKKWEQLNRVPVPNFLKGSMQAMLKAEFGDIPVQYINDTLAKEKHLYQAFLALAKAQESSDGTNRPYRKGRPSTKRGLANANTIATNCGWPDLLEELNAARLRLQTLQAEKATETAKKQAEQDNLNRAIAAGETAECSACFDDLPMNRQIHCNGVVAHFICFDCVLNYIKSEIGQSRCRVLCTAGCGAGFATNQLNLLEDKEMLVKLGQLQQEKDIRDAGLDDLEECPFCDYKAILPPIEEDFEFRCANPECEKISCRRCKSISHIPITCEQHAKDNKINSRHKVEEAMTAALVRSCNKCTKHFIKESGCNKMSCHSCGNLQCYVCSQNIRDYNHFDQNPRGTAAMAGSSKSKLCPLYDNVEERHEREVKEAEAAARAQVVEDNPDVSAEDLEIKVSDAVKKSTAARLRQVGGGVIGAAAGYLGGFMPPMPHIRAPLLGRALELDGPAEEEAEGGFGDAFELLGGFMDERPHARPALDHAARHARLEQARIRRQARRAEVEARLNEVNRIGDQIRAQRAAIPNHVQGYIPVLGFPPAAPAAMRAPHVQGPAQPPDHGPFNFGQAAQFGDGFDDAFLPFLGNPHRHAHIPLPPPPAQPANPFPAINNINAVPFNNPPAGPRGLPNYAAMPGTFPFVPRPHDLYIPPQNQNLNGNQNQPADPRRHFNHLERLRQRHDQQVAARDAVQEAQRQMRQQRELQDAVEFQRYVRERGQGQGQGQG
jgi:TRIAD3 protein (E3 ubiquitin-protein ligase RNF216)